MSWDERFTSIHYRSCLGFTSFLVGIPKSSNPWPLSDSHYFPMFPTSSIVGWQVESGPAGYQGAMVSLITCWLRVLIFCSRHPPISLQLRHLVNGTPPSSSYTLAKDHHTMKRWRKDGLPNTIFYPDFSIASCYCKIRFVLNKPALSLQLIPAAKAAAAAKLQSRSIELVWSKLAKTPNGWII